MSPQTPYVPGPPGNYGPSDPEQAPGHTHYDFRSAPPPVKPRKRRRTGLIVGIAVAAGVFVVACGGTLVAVFSTAGPPASTFSDPPTPGNAAPAATGGTTAGKPTTPAAKVPPVATVDDGTWTAGTDFPAGRYEVTSQADLCVWQVYTGEQPNVQYVDPGHTGPGHYTFTFKAGQHLMTQGCGTWRKTS